MERLKERYQLLKKAVNTLGIALKKLDTYLNHDENYEMVRDSVIKRFEYSMDTFWKFLKEYFCFRSDATKCPTHENRQYMLKAQLEKNEHLIAEHQKTVNKIKEAQKALEDFAKIGMIPCNS